MVFLIFALRSLKAFRLFIVGSLLNFHKAALRRQIAILQSSSNQGVLCLFEAEVFAIVLFSIEMRVSVKCFVWSMMLGSFNSFVYTWFQRLARLLCLFYSKGIYLHGKVENFRVLNGSDHCRRDPYRLSTHSPYSLLDRISLDLWLNRSQ